MANVVENKVLVMGSVPSVVNKVAACFEDDFQGEIDNTEIIENDECSVEIYFDSKFRVPECVLEAIAQNAKGDPQIEVRVLSHDLASGYARYSVLGGANWTHWFAD